MNTEHIDELHASKVSYGEKFQDHALEQYKIFVEMADRTSARRVFSNSLFLSGHTALITLISTLIERGFLSPTIIGRTPIFTAILLCFFWWLSIDSYKKLNSGKFKVIHSLERILPTAPYDHEWKTLSHQKSFYTNIFSITKVEKLMPVGFCALYIFLAISVQTKCQ